MTYTEDRLSGTEGGAGEPGNTSHMAASPPDHTGDANESGELLDYNDSSVLEQFHEDALRQAGCGLSQARVTLAVFLAISGASLELSAIPFILPSAEIELCILPHEKNWLVMISLVGGSLGAVGWGALSERLGRRRCLVSCLAVNAVFAAIAAFMPTYGTFMMARFCSSIGSGGIIPTSYTYAGEMWWRARRSHGLAILPAAAAAGSLLAGGLSATMLPQTGATTLIENKEHFSAWHRRHHAHREQGALQCLAQVSTQTCRHILPAAAAAGSLLAGGLSATMLPQTGATTLIENKGHFSAWHR
ncbi:hypothetical protein PYW07_011689 [Mythimna separata]|uniref:Major facilitator superfamily (MFS) profile domain-containing protein n=1 Tax=Mythimna separata TaxID=271217 RepID=A0AAD8DKL7_MYTSE|nr:hypothetical protein PYW07_011689 [Mythimna separata]